MKKMLALLLAASMILGLLPTFALAAETGMKADKTYIVLAPGNYTDNGAWKIEVDKETGFSYMIAGKDGNAIPESPAKIKVVLPEDGTYKIYSFSKDFDSAPGTRYFDVKLGDVGTYRLGSHGKAGWHWQGSEDITAFAGEYDLSVIDTAGNYARCVMMVVTDDLNYNPGETPDDIKAIAEKQYKEGDLTYTPKDETIGRPNSEIAVKLNGEWMKFDVDPILLNDRTMVPFRAIFEALGCSVSWDDNTETAMGERNGTKIELPIGKKTVRVGGEAQTLDQPAVVVNDRTLVPLRFVSETLGAQVKWLEESQTVVITAAVPSETVLLTQKSITDAGTWTREINAEGALNNQAMRGLIPDKQGATIDDADASKAKPAVMDFSLREGGTYKVWVRSKDFANNQPGDRYFNIGFNDQPMIAQRFGAHGGNGYAWATGGTVELPKGANKVYVYDTSGFYARWDAVLVTKDMNYVPSENYDTLCKVATPYVAGSYSFDGFPKYAREQNTPTESASIENGKTKVVFYKVPTSKGQVVQNEIYTMHNGAWVQTNTRDEELAYIAVRADEASFTCSQDQYNIQASFTRNGQTYNALTGNPYNAGAGTWLIANDYVVSGDNQITVYFDGDLGKVSAVWSMDDESMPKVSANFTAATDGYYSIGAWEGGEFSYDDFEYAVAPFRIQYKRVPKEPVMISEDYLFTPMGILTLPANNKYSAEQVTKGIVVEPSWIPKRWIYRGDEKFGITMNGPAGEYRGAVFAPVMGAPESKLASGGTYNLQYRVISTVSSWYDNYEDVVRNLFDVTDYRRNYNNSLNEAIFNTRELMMDDVYGGWDEHDMAHYNMEGRNWTSVANSMQALQDYLLTEDEDIMTRRAIPTLANALSRKSLHFNRIGEGSKRPGGGGALQAGEEPSAIGSPVSGFNTNVIGGMYEMTRGGVPFLHEYGMETGKKNVTNAYGSIAPFSNNISLYKYTGDKQYLDAAIKGADEYLEKAVYAESNEIPAYSTFIYISYYPNLASLMDIYELTKDRKYLDAAENVAQWMMTGLWVPGVDGDRKTEPTEVNNIDIITKNIHFGKENSTTFWWAGDKQFRIGRTADINDFTASNENITSRTKNVEGWLAARTGLGIEQASTFETNSNIVMQSFVGDFMKLAAYTGNESFATAARNAIIGRFRSYDGYYRNFYETYTQEIDYPREGPDYTGLYWHHIPPFLAMLEDFLINQTFAWSGRNIEFPSLRQQGYAYFNSNQYGYAAGKFYDEGNMWPWLDRGIATTDSIQIDWMAARKDGVMGLALMNEDDTDITTVVTLGDKVPGGASYSGTANLYDKTGKIGTVEVTNGTFTLTVPAKSLQAVTIKIDGVKAPAFSKMEYSLTNAEIGATVSEHENGKGYALQMSPDCYYAYLYVTDMPKDAKNATFTYDIGGGEKQSVTTDVYPFEAIIKVDDVNKELNYSVQVTKADGTTADYGTGTLMTAALSAAKGIKFDGSATGGSTGGKDSDKPKDPVVEASAAAKALKFDAFRLKYSVQGCDENGNFRFVVKKADIPFEIKADNMVGLPVKGYLIDGDNKLEINSYILKTEERGADGAVLTVTPSGDARASKYPNNLEGRNHKIEVTVSPLAK